MRPTYRTGLREALESSLIVDIIAAFLRPHKRCYAVPAVWLHGAVMVLLCLGIGSSSR
jgi:hypothetical protein